MTGMIMEEIDSISMRVEVLKSLNWAHDWDEFFWQAYSKLTQTLRFLLKVM